VDKELLNCCYERQVGKWKCDMGQETLVMSYTELGWDTFG
jgi:hypothetical protein